MFSFNHYLLIKEITFAEITNILQKRINEMHMKNGVTIESSNITYIHDNLKIGRDTVIKEFEKIK